MKRRNGREQLKGHLDLLLLAVLSRGPAHGYDVITALRALSDGEFDLSEGTVYPALHRLEASGLLCSDWSTHGGRRRRTYAITQDGEASLAVQEQAWRRFTYGVGNVLASYA